MPDEESKDEVPAEFIESVMEELRDPTPGNHLYRVIMSIHMLQLI